VELIQSVHSSVCCKFFNTTTICLSQIDDEVKGWLASLPGGETVKLIISPSAAQHAWVPNAEAAFPEATVVTGDSAGVKVGFSPFNLFNFTLSCRLMVSSPDHLNGLSLRKNQCGNSSLRQYGIAVYNRDTASLGIGSLRPDPT